MIERSAVTATKAGKRRDGASNVARLATLVGFAILLVAAVGVFVYLPEVVDQRLAKQDASAEDVAVSSRSSTSLTMEGNSVLSSPRTAVEIQSAVARARAESLLGNLIRKRRELDARGVALWGGDEYSRAVSLAEEGDADLRAREYQAAVAAYDKALAVLGELHQGMDERLTQALDAAERALAIGDSESARQNLEKALAIEPKNPRAQRGLARTEKIDEVFRLLRSGQVHERADRLQMARDDYRAAVALDPKIARAQDALDRVQAEIAEKDFADAMSRGLSALAENDLATARKHLQAADQIKPRVVETKDALLQVQEAIRQQAIAEHKLQATKLEKAEHWSEAAERYGAVLAIDRNIAFAKQGRERSLKLARLHARLDVYLKDPSRLTSQKPREYATQLLQQAATVAHRGPRLADKIAALEKHIKLATTPIRVELRSDNLTDVVIFKVGRFGKFESRELRLQPGTYTVVGSRNGYRDIRRQFTVMAGQDLEPITVRCEERI